MPLLGLKKEEIAEAAQDLERALVIHERWYDELLKTIIFRRDPDDDTLREHAHLYCPFGQWLKDAATGALGRHRAIGELGHSHQRVHAAATRIFSALGAGETFPPELYDELVSAHGRLRSEILATKRELESEVSAIDPLTGAANRIGMFSKLVEQQTMVARGAHPCCLAMIDIDHFKNVNDTYGHAVGDQVLANLANYFMGDLRPYDHLFRYGGEEFLLCVVNAGLDFGFRIIDRLRRGASVVQTQTDEGPLAVTISAGLALLEADFPVEHSIQNADKALYSAKKKGRNRTAIWAPTPRGAQTQEEWDRKALAS